MTYATHVLRHSKKIRSSSNLLRHDSAILVRWFSNGTRSSVEKGDDILRCRFVSVGGHNIPKSFSGCNSGSAVSNNRCRAVSPTVSFVATYNGNALRNAIDPCASTASMAFMRGSSGSQVPSRRCFSTASDLPPHQEIGMPSLSPTMTEGNIARWLKKEGDKVSPGEVLCEVETDKATVEMECMEEGYLAKILRGDGASSIKVGEVIAITVEEEDDIAKFKDYQPSASDATPSPKASPPPPPPKEEVAEKPVTPSEPKASKPSAPADRIFASPLARKLAEDHNIPLSNIKGTGPEGHVVKADIEDYLASRGKEAPAAAPKADAALDYTDIPVSQIRKVTASRLLLSKQTIPHYYLTVDTCVDKLMELRSQLNSLQESSGGKKLSVNDLVIKAAALALRKVPQCNSSWTNDYIRQYHNININVAVQTDNGLYVPVVRDADKKGLSTIAEEVKNLAQKAKENSLKPQDYEGGTFTVSNLGGPFGIKQFCAIINPPQSAILAVGSAERRVIPGTGQDQYKFASMMPVTLSCDHRVIDGAIGAEWLKAFKGYIESPESMLL
ncbi:dihydrolipoyllysine-residue acetyltransferase component 2 of pyruvate dehydrogenase complex, mitochondrial-like isoform X1 [Nicotiana tomentosiformis]|uniref:dihydrolipoyllysine-residue acetyltransferase component 2 of pyruvate dehydrogenase complex, mitochondrial-like isoform X1 n=1 Tax=Nicotiana tomentosiformis TaxID=4098 RepID=UPI00051CA42F|nr:dihydrolipoyllysine-residue acetyltransferase component 2 of pyruvate dehydrogenase complex, mitochondrial-like isoform X1 [Nicotiana tomentosiformis]